MSKRQQFSDTEDISEIAKEPRLFRGYPAVVLGTTYVDVVSFSQEITLIQDRKAIFVKAGDRLIVTDRGNVATGVPAQVRVLTEPESNSIRKNSSIPSFKILLEVAV